MVRRVALAAAPLTGPLAHLGSFRVCEGRISRPISPFRPTPDQSPTGIRGSSATRQRQHRTTPRGGGCPPIGSNLGKDRAFHAVPSALCDGPLCDPDGCTTRATPQVSGVSPSGRTPRAAGRIAPAMKTLAKVLESMLSKPATPSWNTAGPALKSADRPGGQLGMGSVTLGEPYRRCMTEAGAAREPTCPRGVRLYIVAVAALAASSAVVASWTLAGPLDRPRRAGHLARARVAQLARAGTNVGANITFSFLSIIIIASIVLVGPVGCGARRRPLHGLRTRASPTSCPRSSTRACPRSRASSGAWSTSPRRRLDARRTRGCR